MKGIPLKTVYGKLHQFNTIKKNRKIRDNPKILFNMN